MDESIETQIIKAEERLRLAMLNSDVNALNGLLAPELIYTNHLGQLFSKQDDLAAHRSGALTIKELTPSEQHIQVVREVARLYECIQPVAIWVPSLKTIFDLPAFGRFLLIIPGRLSLLIAVQWHSCPKNPSRHFD